MNETEDLYSEEEYNKFRMGKKRVEFLVEEGKTDEAKSFLRGLMKGFSGSFVQDELDTLTRLVGED